ncbi:MAG: transcript cleavage factor, partial [Nitrospirae bacterium]|nr:transcript cleavage factor [Nitrospirota bacterium]
ELSGKRIFPSIQELIKRIQNIEEVLTNISILSFKKRTLIEIRKGREDWKDLFLNLFLTIDYNPLRDYILSELTEAQEIEALKKKLEELCASPAKYPDICLWYFQKITTKETSLPFSDSEGKSRFFEAFLILLSHAEQTTGQRDLIKKMHQILTKNRYSVVRMIMKEATITDVKEFLLLATKCHSLSDHDIKILYSLAEVAHPKLVKKRKTSEEEFVIWTTQEGYNSLQEKIKQIATVETVLNAKEIATARGHGDLRENAEFKAALERRDHLQTELKRLSDQLNQSRIITKDDIATNAVGIGTIVECQNAKEEKIAFTILGPQEADPEKHILSFQSKLAQSMVGRKVGDALTAQGEELKITAILSYLT